MKKTLITVLVLLIFFPAILHAQQKRNKVKTYKVWVTLVDDSVEKGILYSANDQGLEILNAKSMDDSNLKSIEAIKINIIKLRRKGSVGKFAGIGAVAGITSGAIIGSSIKEEEGFMSDLGNELNTYVSIVIGGAVGTGIGAVAGSTKKVITINNHLGIYKEQVVTLKSYSLTDN